jgi:hypothetical protein
MNAILYRDSGIGILTRATFQEFIQTVQLVRVWVEGIPVKTDVEKKSSTILGIMFYLEDVHIFVRLHVNLDTTA